MSNAQLPETRDAAELAGSKKFDTGRPCMRGHLGPRYTSTGGCCACVNRKVARRQITGSNVHQMPAIFPRQVGLANGHRIVRPTPHPDCIAFVQGKLGLAIGDWCIEWETLATTPRGVLQPTLHAAAPLDEYRKGGWTDDQLLKENLAVEVRS